MKPCIIENRTHESSPDSSTSGDSLASANQTLWVATFHLMWCRNSFRSVGEYILHILGVVSSWSNFDPMPPNIYNVQWLQHESSALSIIPSHFATFSWSDPSLGQDATSPTQTFHPSKYSRACCGRTEVQQQETLTGHLPKEMEEEREGRIQISK